MAWTPPGRGELRQAVRIEQKRGSNNLGGYVKTDWVELVPLRRVRLLPVRGGESVQADRLAGVSAWVMDIPADSLVRHATTDMRVVDARDADRVWDIRSILDLEGRGRWLTFTLEMGTADGKEPEGPTAPP